jgi:single-stranded-DNA-specific exonuclease
MPIHEEWVLRPAPPVGSAAGLETGTIAAIASRRANESGVSLETFLHPSMRDLHDASGIGGMDEACQRIERAVGDGEQILIYGDYDVDGVTSIVLLTTVIRILGGKVDHVVPHRLFDGYGLKMSVLQRVLVDRAVKLVITVDCGITSVEPVQQAIESGIDVIITDHHLPPSMLPAAAAVLNPRKAGCDYPYKDLAGVGVAFKLAAELVRRAGSKLSIDSLVKIAAIGTIADVAPLTGENRTIARVGLDGLSDPRNLGLRTLIRHLGLLGKPLRAFDVGFKIGPRINAAKRLASADTAIQLFAARDEATANSTVEELDRLNDQRKTIETTIVDAATEAVIAGGELPNIIVLAREGWHKGVLGLCAGKIAQKFHRPTILLAIDGEQAVGSGRSIQTVNLHELLSSVSEHFTHFGGHEFACGMSLPSTSVEPFERAVKKAADNIDRENFRRILAVDAEVKLRELTPAFLHDHQLLEPFGAGNRQPLFLVKGVRVAERRMFGKNCWELTLDDGDTKRSAVLWPGRGDGLLRLIEGDAALDVAFCVEPDRYGRFGLRLEVTDAAPVGSIAIRNESPLETVTSG